MSLRALHFPDIHSGKAALPFGNPCCLNPTLPRFSDPKPGIYQGPSRRPGRWTPLSLSSVSGVAVEKEKRNDKRFSVCTADELHYVSVPNSDWSLALWRYLPSPQVQPRNHPLLLLSGVATNAIGYDLSPECSFARYMAGDGFDTWILEVRGAGLSRKGVDSFDRKPMNAKSKSTSSSVNYGKDGNVPLGLHSASNLGAMADSDILSAEEKRTYMESKPDQFRSPTKLMKNFMLISERLSSFLNEGMLEGGQNSVIASHIKDLSTRLANIIEEYQRSVPAQLMELQERFSSTLADLQQQLDLIVKYDWDFDHYLQEDVPAAVEYIRSHCKPQDSKLHGIGHSMGGILLYAMLSQCCSQGRDSGFASITTLASSLDYTPSKSSLKLLLPLADPAQALNVPAIPIGALLAAAHPLASRPPYVLSWLNRQISAQDMMHPELFEKLVLNNFCTVPAKLLLQLTTAFQKTGLCDRSGTFFYKDYLHKVTVPVLALGGDQDLICPPEAVYETAKLIPEHLITYKILGEPGGPHYAHYDLVGGRLAADQVYPHIIKFLRHHDMA
ncbi:uncharacterized protein LOC107418607 isoform X1 [Ziziphus jujuba]|uniref:Uncharacterized protein LOC107418607 isoform X1 n=1 Tax=Ziziphus jujuba TaxID=326968 RepID=A0ABM3IIW4_ZIZJJ|nr:uncharacterized protein LOC107418607 isoform X1 [Ziziphus jujuba]